VAFQACRITPSKFATNVCAFATSTPLIRGPVELTQCLPTPGRHPRV
jgi:hypothetical protein